MDFDINDFSGIQNDESHFYEENMDVFNHKQQEMVGIQDLNLDGNLLDFSRISALEEQEESNQPVM